MKLKDIVLHMDASAASQSRLELACLIARRFDAHLTGLLVTPAIVPLGSAMADYGVMLGADVFANIRDEQRVFIEEAGASAERRFREQGKRDGVKFEFRSAVGTVPQQISLRTRYADIGIIGQPDPKGRPLAEQLSAAGEILLTAGRPFLVVPYAGRFPTIGERVLVAWDGSREAARAVNDALPLLVEAKSVTVLSIDPPSASTAEEFVPGADLAIHLARHGVKAEATSIIADDMSIGDVLLSRAADWAIDLIVMGAYGHSRFRELLLGGATRSLLKTMTIPVLMSH